MFKVPCSRCMFMLPNLAPNSFCTKDNSACKSQLKPQPIDLCQIRRTKRMHCFGTFSPGIYLRPLQFKQKRCKSHQVCKPFGHAYTCCLKLLLVLFTPCDTVIKGDSNTKTSRVSLYPGVKVLNKKSVQQRFRGDTYLKMPRPESQKYTKADSSS